MSLEQEYENVDLKRVQQIITDSRYMRGLQYARVYDVVNTGKVDEVFATPGEHPIQLLRRLNDDLLMIWQEGVVDVNGKRGLPSGFTGVHIYGVNSYGTKSYFVKYNLKFAGNQECSVIFLECSHMGPNSADSDTISLNEGLGLPGVTSVIMKHFCAVVYAETRPLASFDPLITWPQNIDEIVGIAPLWGEDESSFVDQTSGIIIPEPQLRSKS